MKNQLVPTVEERMKVLNRLRHDRWCQWREQKDCVCKAGRLLMDLIAAERADEAAGSLPDSRKPTNEDELDDIAADWDPAGGSLTATEPPDNEDARCDCDRWGYDCRCDFVDGSPRGVTPALDVREAIIEVLHRYECDEDPPGHDWREHLPEDEPPHHPNRIDGLVDLFARLGSPALPTASGEDSDDGD